MRKRISAKEVKTAGADKGDVDAEPEDPELRDAKKELKRATAKLGGIQRTLRRGGGVHGFFKRNLGLSTREEADWVAQFTGRPPPPTRPILDLKAKQAEDLARKLSDPKSWVGDTTEKLSLQIGDQHKTEYDPEKGTPVFAAFLHLVNRVQQKQHGYDIREDVARTGTRMLAPRHGSKMRQIHYQAVDEIETAKNMIRSLKSINAKRCSRQL